MTLNSQFSDPRCFHLLRKRTEKADSSIHPKILFGRVNKRNYESSLSTISCHSQVRYFSSRDLALTIPRIFGKQTSNSVKSIQFNSTLFNIYFEQNIEARDRNKRNRYHVKNVAERESLGGQGRLQILNTV